MKKTRKYKKKDMKKKGGSFPDKKVSIRLLEQYNLPRDLTKKITSHLAALTIDDTRKKYLNKRAIKRYFSNFLRIDADDINPSNPELAEMIHQASIILNKNDDSLFWKQVLARIYFALYDEVFGVTTYPFEDQNIDKTEKAFLKLSEKFDLDVTANHYLGSMYVFDLFSSYWDPDDD